MKGYVPYTVVVSAGSDIQADIWMQGYGFYMGNDHVYPVASFDNDVLFQVQLTRKGSKYRHWKKACTRVRNHFQKLGYDAHVQVEVLPRGKPTTMDECRFHIE